MFSGTTLHYMHMAWPTRAVRAALCVIPIVALFVFVLMKAFLVTCPEWQIHYSGDLYRRLPNGAALAAAPDDSGWLVVGVCAVVAARR